MSDNANEIGSSTETEPRHFLSKAQLRPDPALLSEGWERRFVADAQRAKEAMALYAQLGFEVRAEPVTLDQLEEGCEGCHLVALLQFKTIYTRK